MAYWPSYHLRKPRQAFRWIWPLLAALAMLAPLGAAAQQFNAVATQHVNMRAGPDRNWPLVAWIPAGTAVTVVGCIDGWRWCDTIFGFNRGWVYGRFLAIMQQNQPMVILNSGPTLGVPLISFSVGTYWGAHYRNRPWWNQRNTWASRPPTWNRPPPRPPSSRPPARPVPPIAPPNSRPPQGGRPPSGGRPDNNRPGGGSSGGRPGGGSSDRPSGGRPSDSNRPSNRPRDQGTDQQGSGG